MNTEFSDGIIRAISTEASKYQVLHIIKCNTCTHSFKRQ